MMLDPTDLAFFRELATVGAERLGAEHPCTRAAVRACDTRDPEDLRAARRAVDALEATARDTVMREVHHRLAGNLSAIWDQLPGARRDGPAN